MKKCHLIGHKYIPHFTGNKIQIGADAPVGKEVDYYFCENCGMRDPYRNIYPDSQRKILSKFYKN